MRFAALAVTALTLTSLGSGPLVRPALAQDDLSPVEYFDLLHKADAHFAAEQYTEAAAEYERLFRANSRDGRLTYRLALSRYFGGDEQSALPPMLEAIRLGYGRESRLAYEVGKAFAQSGQTETALEWLMRALENRYADRANLRAESEFDPVRDDPDFRELAGYPPDGEATREERWRFDLDYFLEEVRRLHADPDRVAEQPEIAAAVEELKGRVGSLTDQEIVVEMQKIIVRLGDGHSSVWWSSSDEISFARLPLRFYYFSDGLYIIDAGEGYEELIGKRVERIGEKSASGLIDDLRPIVSRDNEQGLYWFGPVRMVYLEILKDLGYTRSLDEVRFTLVDRRGQESVETVRPGEVERGVGLIPPRGASADKIPMYLSDTESLFWHRPLAEWNAHYVQINGIGNSDEKTLEEMAHEVHDALDANGPRNLILDLRHNGGGNNMLIWPLIQVVSAHELASPDNRTFAITGRNTYSACQNFVNFLDRITNTVFVGEVTSAKPNFTGETSPVTLPYAGLQMSISSRYWQDSIPEDRRPWVYVDLPVSLSSRDYFANRDPVMEALGELLDGRVGSR